MVPTKNHVPGIDFVPMIAAVSSDHVLILPLIPFYANHLVLYSQQIDVRKVIYHWIYFTIDALRETDLPRE